MSKKSPAFGTPAHKRRVARERARYERACAKRPGNKWRVLAHSDSGERHEMENRGTFDEVVVDHWLHFEQMNTREWWGRVGDARIWVEVNRDGTVRVSIDRGSEGPTYGRTTVAGYQHEAPKPKGRKR